MRTRLTMATMTAITLAGALTLNAQTPQRPNPQTPTTPQTERQRPMTDDRQRPTTTAGQVVTISGCLKEEKDVPGRKDSLAVRGHMDNDFVLTNVKMAPGSTTSAIALGPMYEIKGLDSQLKGHINHQIEVTGTLEASSSSTTTTGDKNDMPDLHGTSMKMLAATCPAGQ